VSLRRTCITAAALFWVGLLFCFGKAQPFHFIMLTDTQFGMYTADKSFAQETANFEFAVAAMNRLKPGFIIVLGDLVNRAADPAQIGEYKRIAGQQKRSTDSEYRCKNGHAAVTDRRRF